MTSLAPPEKPPASPFGELPYPPRFAASLGSLHRAFGIVNRWFAAPALRAGLGPLFSTPLTGSMMLLRTTGRTSGLRREAPLGYFICDGAVYCCAGFGVQTAWYRNLDADPRVEVLLPTAAFSGIAERVTDRTEWDRVYPAYARALGIVGRLTLGDLSKASPDQLDDVFRSLPLVRIRPTGLAPGPADPGGGLWLVVQGSVMFLAAVLLRRAVARAHRCVGPVDRRIR